MDESTFDSAGGELSLVRHRFSSFEEFSRFFDAWCEKTKALFYVKSSTSLSKRKWANGPPSPDVVDALKYSSLRLACKGETVYQKVQRSQNETAQCKAYIVLRLSENKKSLVVTEGNFTHNHKLCPIEFAYYFRKGYLLANSCLPIRTTNKISKQFIGGEEVRRLVSSCKNRDNGILDTLKSLETLFTLDPGAKVKLVFMEDEVIVRTIFFLTSMMRFLCQRNPLTLLFERMVSVNEEFDLFTIMCIDDFGRGQECAYCLTRKMPDLLRFTLASFVQSVPDLKFKVHCFMLGAEVEDYAVVKEMLPQASVHICRTQVENLLFRKAQEVASLEDEKIWPLIWKLTLANSHQEYNQAVRRLNAMLPGAFMTYFREQWHSCYKLWVERLAVNTVEVDCKALIQHHQQKLVGALKPSSTVAQCILDLVLLHSSKEEPENLTEDEVATRYHAICNPESACLIEEELGFAQHGTFDIKKTESGFSLKDGMSQFYMDRDLISCSCTIHTSSLLPCRHLFATRLWNKNPLFDLKLLKNSSTVIKQIN